MEDLAKSLLDSRTVLRDGEGEVGVAAPAGGGLLGGLSGVVVEVAEVFRALGAAEGRAAAAAAIGEDVAALEAFGLDGDDFWCHTGGDPSPGFCVQNIQKM